MYTSNKKTRVIIIGAGPAGLSAGYYLSKAGIQVDIIEKNNLPGGMCQTIDLWSQKVDLGPHRFFSKEQHVNKFFNELIKDDYTLINRLTRIYYRNKFFYYPLKLFNVLKNLDIISIIQILYFYFKQKLFPFKDPSSFEEWVTNRFGKKLYQIFFKHYTEKLWGINCQNIDADWAAQRIKTLSLGQAILGAIKNNKGNKHKTLLDQFAYPNSGTSMLYERAASRITNNGGIIHYNTSIKEIRHTLKQITSILTNDNKEIDCTHLISSMPITELLQKCNSTPESIISSSLQLKFRNTILVYLEIDSDNLFDDNWIYVHSDEVLHGRITNFRNWSTQLYNKQKTTIICMEYWAFDEDQIWKNSQKEIIKIAKKEIVKTSLVDNPDLILNSKVIKIPMSYPVYAKGYKNTLSEIENYLDSFNNLSVIGRYGAFKYNNQDHSILMGILASENIVGKNGKHNLWKINTDTEYQEEKKIKDVLIQ